MPQVGPSTHEIGRTQPGSSEIGHEEAADEPDRVLERRRRAPTRGASARTPPPSGSRARRSSRPSPTTPSANGSGCTTRSVDAEEEAAPRAASRRRSRGRSSRSRASSAAARARSCDGATTSSSSVPNQRSRWSAELAGTLVAVQIPITAAPSPIGAERALPMPPARNMKNATVAKKSGQRIAEQPVERRARHHLEVQHPAEAEQPERGHHSAVTSATYASSSVGSREATRPTSTPSSSASSGCGQLALAASSARSAAASGRAPRR